MFKNLLGRNIETFLIFASWPEPDIFFIHILYLSIYYMYIGRYIDIYRYSDIALQLGIEKC